MKPAYRIEFAKNKEIIAAEALDGEGIDLLVRMNGIEVLKVFGTEAQCTELISALRALIQETYPSLSEVE